MGNQEDNLKEVIKLTSISRRVKILNYLSQNDTLSDKELENKIKSTSQTLKKDIEELNESMSDAAIIHFKHHHYSLEIVNHKKFKKIMDGEFKHYLDFNSSHKRVAFIIHYLIEKNNYVIIDDLSEIMSISRSTLNNDIKKAKVLLNKYSISIKGVPNKGIRIVGTEFNFRLALLYLVYDYYFSKFELSSIISVMLDEIADEFQLNYQNKSMLKKVIAVSVKRLNMKYELNKMTSLYQNYEKENDTLQRFFSLLSKEIKMDISEKERDFMSFPINTGNSSSIKVIKSQEYEKEIRYIFDQMIQTVEESYFINMNTEVFYNNIKHHLMLLINRLAFHVPLNDIFSDNIQLKFPLAFELAKVSTEVFKQKYQLEIDETDTSYLAVYFALFLEEAKVTEEKNVKKIAVISNTGRGTFELVKRQLQEVVGIDTEIHHINEIDYENKNLQYYDFIVTLIPVKIEDAIPVIKINSIFDREYIAREIDNINLPSHSMSSSEIENNIDFSYFKLSKDFNYRSNVTFMIEQLVEDNLLDQDFYKRWEERENIQPMVYDNGIAIPHTVNKGNAKFVLSIGVYEDAVMASKDKVKIIFLLGVPETLEDKQQQYLTFIYDKIFSFGTNKNDYEELLQAKNDVQIKSVLLKGW